MILKVKLLIILTATVVFCSPCSYDESSFDEIYEILKEKNFTDISRYQSVPTTFQMFPNITKGQSDQTIPFEDTMISRLFVPLQVIDISEEIKGDAKFKPNHQFLKQWEKKWGKIPYDSIVLLKTNRNNLQFSGWNDDFLEYLFEERQAYGVGHDQVSLDLPGGQTDLFIERLLIQQCGDLNKNPPFGGLIQLRKLDQQKDNIWQVKVMTTIPELMCSMPKKLVSQWGNIIIILFILLALIALIWYCCLKRFDKYNKEPFKVAEWDMRNQEKIYFDQTELDVPLDNIKKNQN